ncbi:anthranilate synthase component 1 [bacterium BMS3Abin07]|nr:anthranilate synthase component 1 [bacterium BMS3Abin07]GBE33076.1 anthranilate synthase component 1 [bacterium BMS3Bbin05]
MIYPSFDEFRGLSEAGNLVPVYKEVLADTETPVSAFLKLAQTPSFLLESVEGGEKWARYSFIGIKPSRIIKGTGRRVEIIDESGNVNEVLSDDPLNILKSEMGKYKPVIVPELPRFCGGLVGYIGYDCVRFFESIPDKGSRGLDMPDIFFMLADTILVFDSLRQKIKVVTNVFLDGVDLRDAYEKAVRKVEEIVERLKTERIRLSHEGAKKVLAGDFKSSFPDREDFIGAVERSKKYIVSGDVIQVVLSQRFERECRADAFSIYRALRVINPSPYMFYIDTGMGRIVGSSPEILVRVEEEGIVLRPIAGTRRRGKSEDEDMAMESELRNDPKEIAEHVMLVDLGRNDVGRVAETGSVEVTDMMYVERYSHVMHLVSNVVGKLGRGKDVFDVIRACFPAGTVTGAPKIRAMEIIEELEPVRRGPYAGAVGYFSFSGNMDMCITIRTLICKDGKIYVQAGAGIVADSDPGLEYKETVNKAMGMMKAVEMAEAGID